MEECKRCLLLESNREDILKTVREHIERIPENKKASDEVYSERLALCRDCDMLISGVCAKCGCYVEFRAAFADQQCPNVKNRKWYRSGGGVK